MIKIFFLIVSLFFINTAYAVEKSNTEKSGDIIQLIIPAAAYSTTYFVDDQEGRGQFYWSFFTNIGITQTLKYTINKPRPENNGNRSFPSGHTSAAFQGASFIHHRYGFKSSIPAYLGASFVGWSRMEGESDKHDGWDVAVGAVIGTMSSYYFTTPYKNLVIMPTVGVREIGIDLSYSW